MTARTETLRNTLFSSANIYIEYFLGMLAAVLVARELGPADYGIYGLFMWLAAVGIVITNAGVTTGVIKFVAELRGKRDHARINTVIQRMRRAQLWHLGAMLGLATSLYLVLQWQLPLPLHGIEFVLLLVATCVRAMYMFNISIAKGFEAFGANARVAMVAAPVNLALVGAAVLLEGTILWFVVVYFLSSFVFLAISSHEARRLTRGLPPVASLTPELQRRMRHHLRVVSVTVIVGFLIASDLEVLFLNLYASARDAGFFKVAYQLAKGMALLVPGVFGAVLLPMMTRALGDSRKMAQQRFRAVTSYLALLAAPVIVFGVGFAPAVITMLYGASYAAAAPVFAVVVAVASIGTMTHGATSLLVGADRQRTILVFTVLFGALKLALDLLLILRFGLMGAMVAVAVSSLAGSATYLWLGMRVSGARLDWMRLLRTAMAGAAAAVAALPVTRLAWSPVWIVLLGGTVVVIVYALFTLLLGCWNRADLQQMKDLHLRFAGGHPRALARLLAWAGARAENHG